MGRSADYILTNDPTAPADWAWGELEAQPPGPEAEAALRAEEEERHVLEVAAAYERGVLDGQDAGATLARDELKVAMGAVLETLESVREQRVSWSERLRDDLVILAAAMASKIVEEKIDDDPRIFEALTRKAIAHFRVDEPVRIRLHPAELDTLHETGAVVDLAGERTVRWMPDEELARGGCIVEGPDKVVDGRVDEALHRMIRELTNA